MEGRIWIKKMKIMICLIKKEVEKNKIIVEVEVGQILKDTKVTDITIKKNIITTKKNIIIIVIKKMMEKKIIVRISISINNNILKNQCQVKKKN